MENLIVCETEVVLIVIHNRIIAELFIALLSIPLPAHLFCYWLSAIINLSLSVLVPC